MENEQNQYISEYELDIREISNDYLARIGLVLMHIAGIEESSNENLGVETMEFIEDMVENWKKEKDNLT
jgi:hypothetical protein